MNRTTNVCRKWVKIGTIYVDMTHSMKLHYANIFNVNHPWICLLFMVRYLPLILFDISCELSKKPEKFSSLYKATKDISNKQSTIKLIDKYIIGMKNLY